MYLFNSTKAFYIQLNEATTTTECDVTAHYVDDIPGTPPVNPVPILSRSSGTYANQVFGPPTAGTIRTLSKATVVNRDSVSHTVFLMEGMSGTYTYLAEFTLSAGGMWDSDVPTSSGGAGITYTGASPIYVSGTQISFNVYPGVSGSVLTSNGSQWTSVSGTSSNAGEVGNGWTAGLGTWSYSSADAPIFVISTSVDNSTVVQVGDRIQLTQTTAKYFIVHAITSSTITVYGGTDYTLANAAITSPYYSHVKNPYGFPLDEEKWTVTVTDANQRSAACAAGTYLNVNSAVSISVPIGRWSTKGTKVGVQCVLTAPNSIETIMAALSTSTSSASDTNLEMQIQYFYLTGSYINSMLGTYNLVGFINVAAKITYYLIMSSTYAGTAFYRGDNTPSVIKLVDTYL